MPVVVKGHEEEFKAQQQAAREAFQQEFGAGQAAASAAKAELTTPKGATKPSDSRHFEYQDRYYTEQEINRLPAPTPTQTTAERILGIKPDQSGRQILVQYDAEKKELNPVTSAKFDPKKIVRIPESRWTPFMQQASATRPVYGTQLQGPASREASRRATKRRKFEQEKYEYQKGRYDKWVAEQESLTSASHTWQARAGQLYGWEQIGGVKTAWDVFIDTPLQASLQSGVNPAGVEMLFPGRRQKYTQALTSQFGKLKQKYEQRQFERTAQAYYDPKGFMKEQAIGIAITGGTLLLPEVLPVVSGAATAIAPKGFMSLAKVVIGAGVAGYGAREVQKAYPKVRAGEPGATFDVAMGAGMLLAGAHVAVSGGSEWLRWRGKELMRSSTPDMLRYQDGKLSEIRIGDKTYTGRQARAKYAGKQLEFYTGAGMQNVGQVPQKVTNFFRPPKQEWITENYIGTEDTYMFDTAAKGEYGGGWMELESGRKVRGRITPTGTILETRTPVLESVHAGLPKSESTFDVIGFHGGKMKVKHQIHPESLDWERALADSMLPKDTILDTVPSYKEVLRASQGELRSIRAEKIVNIEPVKTLEIDTWKNGVWKDRMLLDKGVSVPEVLTAKISAEESFTNLIDAYPDRMLRRTGSRKFIGNNEIIGTPTEKFTDVLPEGSKGFGRTSYRFVEGPKEFKPAPVERLSASDLPKVKEAKWWAGVDSRLDSPQEVHLAERIAKLDYSLAMDEPISMGHSIAVKSGNVAYVPNPTKTQPKYVSAPLRTYSVSPPGRPAMLSNPELSIATVRGGHQASHSVRAAPPVVQNIPFSKVIPKGKMKSDLRPMSRVSIRPDTRMISSPKMRSESKPMIMSKSIPALRPKAKPKAKPKVIQKPMPKIKFKVRPRPKPRVRSKPRPRGIPIIIPASFPGRPSGGRKRRAKIPSGRRKRGTVMVVPRADYLTLHSEELRTGRKALQPPITRMTTRAYERRRSRPDAPVMRFPTAGGLRRIMKDQNKKKKGSKKGKRQRNVKLL